MNKDRYLIGDVANLMGMSRDTLRHYEKRGLVTAKKAENGYRYYTEARHFQTYRYPLPEKNGYRTG